MDQFRFYTAMVANLKNKYKEIHASAAEVLGMVLHYIAEKKHVCALIGMCFHGYQLTTGGLQPHTRPNIKQVVRNDIGC